jgi:hypothetical protein
MKYLTTVLNILTWFIYRNRIQDLKQQTELLEAQCEAVQQELGWQYLILKQAVNVESR